MHFCYIIYSTIRDKYYTGETPDVIERLIFHNNIELNTNSTKAGIPWEVKLVIECTDRALALKVEKHIKKMKSRIFIENLIKYPELVQKILSNNH
jgi:putative endonuclease